MASLRALKKLVSSNLLPKSLRATRQAIPASRLFNTNAGGEFDDGESDEDDEKYGVCDDYFDDDRGVGHPYPDISDILFHKRLNMMDKIKDTPSASRGILPRRWEATKTKKGFYVLMDVPEWKKENVNIWGQHNYIFIQEMSDDSIGKRFRIEIEMPSEFYKSGRIKAEMKNGVLKIVVLRGPWERERAEDFYVEVV